MQVRRALPAGIMKPPQLCLLHLPAIAFALQATKVRAKATDAPYAQWDTTKRRQATLRARHARWGIRQPAAR